MDVFHVLLKGDKVSIFREKRKEKGKDIFNYKVKRQKRLLDAGGTKLGQDFTVRGKGFFGGAFLL